MKLLAQGLSSPRIQERLVAINQSQKQTQQTLGQQKEDRGQGLSM